MAIANAVQTRYIVAITTVWSGLGYLFSRDAVIVLNWFVGRGVGMGTSDGVQDVRVEQLLKCTGRRRRFGFAFQRASGL